MRSSPFASSAFEGMTTRSPGTCVKITSPHWLWYTAPPCRYPPYVTRITTGHLKVPFERQRMSASSLRICMYAGQM